jgi:pimeloyl-ACP methyl ester carboxylesterase
MPNIHVNGTTLHYETWGEGPPLFLVHGSWVDHTGWLPLAELLADDYKVVTYDRRGHSRSDRPRGLRTRWQDEADLAALIEHFCDGPAHVVGNSFGGLIGLALAARRPSLVRSIAVHEPPAVSVAAGDELERLARDVRAAVALVLDAIDRGDAERAASHFVEEVALGQGGWDLLPDVAQAICTGNAQAFAAEQRDLYCDEVDTGAVERFAGPILLTKGEMSPRWFQLVIDRLAELIPSAATATIAGAGHTPHVSHAGDYARTLREFLGASAGRSPRTAQLAAG